MYYWGLIPEQVYEITRVTTKQSKKIYTQNISYSFTHPPKEYFTIGIKSVALTKNQTVLLANAEK